MHYHTNEGGLRMGLLDMLLGNSEAKAGFEDFLNRFEEGPPSEGYEDQEVLNRYGDISHEVSQSEYEEAARDAFGHLSPRDREEFGRMLAGQAQQRGIDLSGFAPSQEQGFGNLDWLSSITGQLHQQPGRLRDLLGGLTGRREAGVAGSIFSSPLAKAALAGIAAMLVKRFLGRR
jgi:hypothetical protein